MEEQGRPMDFNVTRVQKFTNMVSDATLWLTFKQLQLATFWYSIKECIQLSKKAIKILPVLTVYVCEASFLSFTAAKLRAPQSRCWSRNESVAIFY